MSYTPIFEKPYPDGWENLPSEDTPITATALDGYDDAIVNIEDYLENNTIPTDIEDLGDINITTPTDGQALIYDSASSKWVNGAGGGGGGVVGIASIYTDTERQIGLFSDGRPLYQKSYVIPAAISVTSAWTDTGITLPNEVDKIVNGEVYRNTSAGLFSASFNISNHALRIRFASSETLDANSIITIQYTKSSDSPTTLIPSSASAIYMMGDVAISSIADGQILKYNSASQKWENSAESAGGGSTITITTSDSSLYGETVTLSDGTTTLTTTFSNGGEATFSGVTLTGTLTITCDIYSMTESVPYFGNYEFVLTTIPEGSTVLPTDDIQTWLACAGITDKSYTTLAEVLADSTTLLALMSNNNAVDYLVRSTTWASGLTADSTAMTDIGANNYCANTLLADSTWLDAICDSTYFESVLNAKIPTMTSNTTPSGVANASSIYSSDYEAWKAFNGNDSSYGWASTGGGTPWVQYQFADDGIVANKVRFYHTMTVATAINLKFNIQGSNDGLTFEDIATGLDVINYITPYVYNFSNSTKYKYYRFVETTGRQSTGSGTHIQIWGR